MLFVHNYMSNDDQRHLSPAHTANVILHAFDLSLSLSVELTRFDHMSLDATGVSWDAKIGSYRIRIAAQEGKHAWLGAGSVRSSARRFQFELILQVQDVGAERSMCGSGTVRSDGSFVFCIIQLCEKAYIQAGS